MRIVCKEQRTHEWFAARTAVVTGSNVSRAMSKLKRASGDRKAGEWSKDHDSYVEELAWEIITRVPAEHYVSKAMDLGSQYESEARIEWMMATGLEVEMTGFVLHPTLDYFGSSFDGYVIENGIPIPLELKVPLIRTHERYLIDDVVPEDYIPQVQAEMICCDNAPYAYFASYAPPELYPELPEEFRLFKKRLDADIRLHGEMEDAATITMEQAIALSKVLREKYPRLERPQEQAGPLDPLGSDFDYLDDNLAGIP